jgi:hypothetical protein
VQRAAKGPKLTPLEQFLRSNSPLQGHGLFRSASDERNKLLGAAAAKAQDGELPGSSNALEVRAEKASPEIAAYRPRVGATIARKDREYAQHLENVHRYHPHPWR